MSELAKTQHNIEEERRLAEEQRVKHLQEIKDKDPEASRAIAEIVQARDAEAAHIRQRQHERFDSRINDAIEGRKLAGVWSRSELGTTEAWHRRQLEPQLRTSDRNYLDSQIDPYNKDIDRLRHDFVQKEAEREKAHTTALEAEVARYGMTRDRRSRGDRGREPGRYDILNNQHEKAQGAGQEVSPEPVAQQVESLRQAPLQEQDRVRHGQTQETPAQRATRVRAELRAAHLAPQDQAHREQEQRAQQQRAQDPPERGQERKQETAAERVARVRAELRGGNKESTDRVQQHKAVETTQQRDAITRTDGGRGRGGPER